MIDFDGRTLSALTFLSGCISDWRVRAQLIQKTGNAYVDLSIDMSAQFLKSLQVLSATAKQLEMAGVAVAAERSFNECLKLLAVPIGRDDIRLGQVIGYAEQAIFPFMDELQARVLFTMSPRHASLFSAPTAFGEAVDSAFPSASYDIAEAAKCRSLARWTACVMHLMRVLEVGLGALADKYEVDGSQNWNTALNQIEAKSREIGKRSHGAEEEKWAAEAAVHLRFIKNAWRNHAMHPLEKYDEDRAVAIFDNAKSFMQHLAEKLAE